VPSVEATADMMQSGRFAELDMRFSELQQAYGSRAVTDEDLRAAYRAFYNSDPALATKYDSWVSKFPKSYAARLARGIYYSKVGESRRGAQSTDETPIERINDARVAYDKALTDLNTSISLDARPILSYVHEMTVSQWRGDLSESRKLLDQADRIDPDNYVARAKYMSVIETRWGGSQAIMLAFLDECRHTKLSGPNIRLLESVVVEDQGWNFQFVDRNWAAAETAYRRSAALGGDKQLANLVVVLWQQRKYQEMIEPLTQQLELHPDDSGILATRANAYTQTGRPRDALADWTAAATGGDANAQNNLGAIYMNGIPGVLAADPKVGIEWFRKSADQGSAEARQNLVRASQLPNISSP
jgi:tetratricopeptide (TPR) repeat protein